MVKTMLNTTQKGSLMQRMASPAAVNEKGNKLGNTAGTMNLGSTMAGTKRESMSGTNS